jgi:hypothetical protein
MWVLGMLAGLGLVGLMLVDSFETTVLPRRVTHRYRFARLFYRSAWAFWRALAVRVPPGKWREAFLSPFGPLSMLGLLATWVLGLILGFALLHWSAGTPLHVPDGQVTFGTYLYWSGNTFFTLGYGDVTPVTPIGRTLAVAEAGMGFGFLALTISYLPVLYQAFSRRELTIALLDARAGSPPSAGEFLLRLGRSGDIAAADAVLAEWERWAAELLESHLSFPVLSYYRSQHDNQSWLAALTAVLDACALLLVAVKGRSPHQAQVTFAMARHAAVDLALVFQTPPEVPDPDRLPDADLQRLRERLRAAGFDLQDGSEIAERLTQMRRIYEPFVNALARRLLFTLPPIASEAAVADNWQRSAWMQRAPAIGNLPTAAVGDRHHFD